MEENVKVALEKQNPWWFNQEFYSGIDRLSYYSSILKYLKTPEILLLVGARRTGKSTLLYQVIKQMLEKESPESILFINLDEPLFQSKADNPAFLSSIIEEYQSQKKLYVFIDEIQNYDYWVQTIKAMYDTQKNIKFILTGSSSTLIQSAITTKLSGRYFYVKVSPLSFSEFLAFNLIKKPSTLEIRKNFDNYLKFGAFPRVVLEKDEKLKLEILKNYFQTIYLKDVIYSHNLRNNKEVFELLYFIISNVGSPFSYSHIAKILHISADTVKEYVQYAEESYLIGSITKFDYSLKKQMANPKKIYCIDTGIVNAVAFQFSENKGKLLENFAYVALSKENKEVYYHRDTYECDFIVKENTKITEAIQVTLSLENENARKREIRGLVEAMNAYNLKTGLILTESESEEINICDKIIIVKPFYSWLLGDKQRK